VDYGGHMVDIRAVVHSFEWSSFNNSVHYSNHDVMALLDKNDDQNARVRQTVFRFFLECALSEE